MNNRAAHPKLLKSDGQLETFHPEKLRASLEATGAGGDVIDEVLREIQNHAGDPLSTRQIYNIAFRRLRKSAPGSAGRYRLKRAIFELGPSGFPFEHFVGALFAQQGFDVEVGILLDGVCVTHEVDVLATKGKISRLIECKFHRTPSRKSTIQVPLYIHARFEDIRKSAKRNTAKIGGWLFTNTRFSADALDYGRCVGLNMVDWEHPRTGSLKQRIDRSGLHPLTCLTSLNKAEKQQILKEGWVLCRDLNAQILTGFNLSEGKISSVLQECDGILSL